MKTKTILIAFFAVFLQYSCVTRKACDRKFPSQINTKDSISEKTVIHYRDTIIRDTIPGQTITLLIPPGKSGSAKKGNLKLSVKQTDKGTEVECTADSLQRELKLKQQEIDRVRSQVRIETKIQTVERVPWWAWCIMGIGAFFSTLYIIRLVIKRI